MYNDKKKVVKTQVFQKLPNFDKENAQVFFDIEIGNVGDESKETGRIVLELFTK